jgi:DNA-binding NtrC family response regulator
LTLWQQHSGIIDLLFTDMVMPEGMSGADLAERLREKRSTLKVIIASGYSAEIFCDNKARIEGATYVQKPYQLRSLSKTIRDCLDGK